MLIMSIFLCFMPNYIWFLTFIIFFIIRSRFSYVYEFELLVLLLLLLSGFWLVWSLLFYSALGEITVWFVWFVELFFIVWLDELEIN